MAMPGDQGFFWSLIRNCCFGWRRGWKSRSIRFCLFLLNLRLAFAPPDIKFGFVGEYSLLICKAPDRQAQALFPALHGADLAFEVGSNLLPGIETLADSSVPRLRPGLRTSFAHSCPWESTA